MNQHTDARGELVFELACKMGLEGIVSTTRAGMVSTFVIVVGSSSSGGDWACVPLL